MNSDPLRKAAEACVAGVPNRDGSPPRLTTVLTTIVREFHESSKRGEVVNY
jgi:hypothetical protein